MPIPNSANDRLFLGIEGGATRTVAILAGPQEQLFQRIEAGPANLRLLNDAELLQHLAALARKLPFPTALCIGLAGLRSEQDRARVRTAAARVWPQVPCRACADLETGLAAAEDTAAGSDRPQVLVLSGTGSCCYGRSPEGRIAKVGGWGHLLGDKGSGYEIGLRALKACLYYYDVDGVWPKLGQGILRALQLNQPDDLIGWAHAAGKQAIAGLALEVFAAWTRHDKIAADILDGAAHSLVKDASSCAKRLQEPPLRDRRRIPQRNSRPGTASTPPVRFILAGSVLLKQPRFAKLVSERLAERWPQGEIRSLQKESAWGAVRLAQAEWESSQGARDVARLTAASSPSTRHRTRQAQTPAEPPVPEDANREFPIPESVELSPTERRNPRSVRLHQLALKDAITLMLSEEGKVPAVLLAQRDQIAQCIELIVRTFHRGGRLFYVGAGTSGRLGALDASECPPTFRAPPEQVQAILAGGQVALWQSIEGAEDDAGAGADAVQFRGVTGRDVVIGIAASGRTPFVWGALTQARRCGAKTILLSFNPYLKVAAGERPGWPDLVLALDLGPEVLTGSTRLKAGTATKLLLNLFTTLSMVKLGKVVSNLMVDLNPSNQKLRQRAIRIVRELTGADPAQAQAALEKSGWIIQRALKRFP